AFHGEQIAVCTLAMAELQEQLLARDTPPVLYPSAVDREHVLAHFGPRIGETCWSELAQKRFDLAHTDELNARLASRWDAMRSEIAAVTPGAAAIRRLLADAGAPMRPADLQWPIALF